MKKDPEKTLAARFEHVNSYVARDGREVLFGLDWRARKQELWERSKGHCEHNGCMAEADDPHHLVKRSELRDDRLANLKALCRRHHDLLDPRKPRLKWLTKT